jgi:hypothetical protein
MNNSHGVVIDMTETRRNADGSPAMNTHAPQLMIEQLRTLGPGTSKKVARTDVMPKTGVGSGHTSPMLSARPRGGIGAGPSTDPRNLVTEVGGVELTLAQAQQLGLARQYGGRMEPGAAFVAAKTAEGAAAAEAADAEAMVIADEATSTWLVHADRACTAAGMNGLDDLVHAAMHAESPEALVDLFSAISPTPQEAAVDFSNIIQSWTSGLAAAMGMDVEQVDELLDEAVEEVGLGAVVGRALAGAHRKSYGPILALLRKQLA